MFFARLFSFLLLLACSFSFRLLAHTPPVVRAPGLRRERKVVRRRVSARSFSEGCLILKRATSLTRGPTLGGSPRGRKCGGGVLEGEERRRYIGNEGGRVFEQGFKLERKELCERERARAERVRHGLLCLRSRDKAAVQAATLGR